MNSSHLVTQLIRERLNLSGLNVCSGETQVARLLSALQC